MAMEHMGAFVYEYRLVSRFSGAWTLEARATEESWKAYYHSSPYSSERNLWRYECCGSYKDMVDKANRLTAQQNYVPTVLTPPFPDQDPKKKPTKKRWLLF